MPRALSRGDTGKEESALDENRGYQGKRLQPKKRAAKFWSDYGYLLVTVAVVFVLFKVVFQLAYVPTGSMETTVPSKSLMVCWRLPYVVSDPVPERGEVVDRKSVV